MGENRIQPELLFTTDATAWPPRLSVVDTSSSSCLALAIEDLTFQRTTLTQRRSGPRREAISLSGMMHGPGRPHTPTVVRAERRIAIGRGIRNQWKHESQSGASSVIKNSKLTVELYSHCSHFAVLVPGNRVHLTTCCGRFEEPEERSVCKDDSRFLGLIHEPLAKPVYPLEHNLPRFRDFRRVRGLRSEQSQRSHLASMLDPRRSVPPCVWGRNVRVF